MKDESAQTTGHETGAPWLRFSGPFGDHLSFVIAALIILCNAALAIHWILADRMPPFWDAAWYLYDGAMQHDALRNSGLLDWYRAWVIIDRLRPCFASTLTIPFFAVFGVSNDAGLLVNILMSSGLLAALFLLGRASRGNVTGLMAMCVGAGYPLVIGLTHVFLVEMTKMAFIAGSLLALWSSDGFRRRGWSLFAANLLALGCVTKIIFPLFIAGPWLVTLLMGTRERCDSRIRLSRNQAINLTLTIVVPLSLAATWYVPNFRLMWNRTVSASIGAESVLYGPDSPLRWENVLAYLNEFIGQDCSVWAASVFCVASCGLLWAVVRCARQRSANACRALRMPLFCASSFLPAYLFLNGLRNQDHNHVSGVLPAMALFTAWGLHALLGRHSGLFLPVLILMATVQAVSGTDPALFTRLGLEPLQTKNHGRLVLFYTAQSPLVNPRYAAPEREDWRIGEVLRHARDSIRLRPAVGSEPRVGVIPNHPGIDEAGLLFAARCTGIPMRIEFAVPERLSDYDVLIGKLGDQGFPNRASEIESINKTLALPDAFFVNTMCPIRLPDGSPVLVYARREEAPVAGQGRVN